MFEKLLLIFTVAALPVSELRLAIPLGIFVYHVSPLLVFLVAILGNFLIVIPLLLFLERFSGFLMRRYQIFERFFKRIFARTRRHHAHKFEKWEHWALVFLVAIPLPLTGAWTGALAAFLFGIPPKKALPLIFSGIIIAGIIVVFLSLLGFGTVLGGSML
jgi:uncharacterized membrane protein